LAKFGQRASYASYGILGFADDYSGQACRQLSHAFGKKPCQFRPPAIFQARLFRWLSSTDRQKALSWEWMLHNPMEFWAIFLPVWVKGVFTP
jgi:hypothetical protein